MYLTDRVNPKDYFSFHMFFFKRRIYDQYDRQLSRPFVWAIACEMKLTYAQVEKEFIIRTKSD